MKIGLVGFSGSGKSTVFRWLTGVAPDPSRVQQGQIGTAKLPDPRVDKLSAMFKPKRTTYAEIAFLDTPGLDMRERRDNPRRLGILREANGLVVVLTGFSIGDLSDELKRFREEILSADLEILTNRLSKVQANLRKPKSAMCWYCVRRSIAFWMTRLSRRKTGPWLGSKYLASSARMRLSDATKSGRCEPWCASITPTQLSL